MERQLDELVEALASAAGAAGLFSDFDGTLAEIVADPATAAPLRGTPELLASIADHLGTVAVVSGRPVGFLEHAFGAHAGRLLLFGLYGAERRLPAGRAATGPAAAAGGALSAGWQAALAAAAGELDPLPAGTELEDKGASLAVHWRRAPEAGPRLEALARQVAAEHGLEARPAKQSIELLPPGQSDKGAVVRELAAPLAAACFVGDDIGDLPAFRALVELAGGGLRAWRVAVRTAETPPELLAEADAAVEGPSGARELLQRIDRRLRR